MKVKVEQQMIGYVLLAPRLRDLATKRISIDQSH